MPINKPWTICFYTKSSKKVVVKVPNEQCKKLTYLLSCFYFHLPMKKKDIGKTYANIVFTFHLPMKKKDIGKTYANIV